MGLTLVIKIDVKITITIGMKTKYLLIGTNMNTYMRNVMSTRFFNNIVNVKMKFQSTIVIIIRKQRANSQNINQNTVYTQNDGFILL